MLSHKLRRYKSGAATDANFKQTTLLLHGDGTNGGQNNSFTDGSTNNFTITRNGNTTQGTFSPFSVADGEWSNYFDGTGDYLITPSSTSLDCAGDFTFECNFYLTATVADYRMFISNATSNNTYIALKSGGTGGLLQIVAAGADQANLDLNNSVVPNTWNHIAVVRSGTTLTGYINGVSLGSATSSASFNFSNGQGTAIGVWGGGGNNWFGYLSNLRIVKGTAVYTANFTPSTTPLTAITNTSLLTCQSNRFRDASTNNFTITRNGDVTVRPFSPFAPTAAYSASTNGGSGYFDGTGDYLTVPNNTALNLESGDFTVEAWFYTTSSSGIRPIVVRFNGNAGIRNDLQFFIGVVSGNLQIAPYSGATNYNMIFSSVPLNQWNHCALVRTGNTFYAYLNGERNSTTQTITGNLNNGTWETWIGGYREGGVFSYQLGYIGDVRILKGTAQYTGSTYTVPTAPLTAITNTSLLCNFTNAAIIDNTGKNVLETVGNAQLDTGTKKFGTAALEFDGNGDYLINSGNTDLFAFGSGDFTIEFWVYSTSFATDIKAIYDQRPTLTQGLYPTIYFNTSGVIFYYTNSANRITGSTLSTNTWYHVAVSRSGTSTKMFVNGVQVGSTYTDSNIYLNSSGRPFIGAFSDNQVANQQFNGYIDDLRITKGVARYTANFTAPTAPFEDR